jgi:GT2 family glycosyltransferase
VLDLPEASNDSRVHDLDEVGSVWGIDARQRLRYLRFNNVASSIRADIFRRYPFPSVGFGEDFAWAARILTAGHRVAFTADCTVYHGHDYSPGEAYHRYNLDAAFHRATHGWNMRPSLLSVLRGVAYEVLSDVTYLKGERWRGASSLLRSPVLRFAQVWGQYKGGQDWQPLDPNFELKPFSNS